MSTKIYNGYKLPSMTAFELNQFMNQVREQINLKVEELLSQQVAHIAVSIVDSVATGTSISTDYKHPGYGKAPRMIAYMTIAKRYEDIRQTMIREPMYDYGFQISILPIEDKILCVVHTERGEFFNLWNEFPEVEEYGYWDGTDRPENVTEKEWDQRALDWEDALGDSGIPGKEGMSADIVHYILARPEPKNILKNIPSHEARVKSIAIREAQAEKFKQYYDKDKDNALLAFESTAKYMKSLAGKTRIEKLEKKFSKVLKTELTIEDLDQDVNIREKDTSVDKKSVKKKKSKSKTKKKV